MSIEALLTSVEKGTTKRFDCPYCGGKNTLTVSKEFGKVMYNCYRKGIMCDLKPGQRFIKMSREELYNEIGLAVLRHAPEAEEAFTMPIYWVKGIASKNCFQMLLKGNALDSYLAGLFKIAYDPRQERLAFLVQDTAGKVVGAVGRTLTGQKPKVLNYNGTETPFTCGEGDIGVLVEDCLSACSIARIKCFTGIAMLGGDLKPEYLHKIVRKYKGIVIAHDKDALSKSLIVRRYVKQQMDNVSIWKLKKDLKDMSKTEIEEFMADKSNSIN